MAKSNVKSRQFRIDSMISNFFIFLLIPLVALLGFKYFTKETLPEVNFDVLGDEHMENEMLKFRNNTAGDHSYEWNFGDSTDLVQERSPIHIYSQHGDYTVTLIVDNQFEYQESIHVERKKEEEEPMVVIPRIAGPKKVYVGASVFYTCSTKGGHSWAWRVNGSNKIYSNKKSVKLTFSKAGYKTISLEVDGNSEFIAEKKIYVGIKPRRMRQNTLSNNVKKPKKEEEYIPETPEVYTIFDNIEREKVEDEALPSDADFTAMFLKIAKKTGNKKKFLKYFYDNNKYLMVKCNGDLITFEELIKDVEGVNIVLKEFTTVRRNNTKIINVTVRYKKKRRLN